MESSEPLSREAIDRLVENHRAFLGFLEARVGDRSAAEEILQDAFARGLSRIEQLRDDESVVAWFYRTLRNAVIDHHRRGTSRARGLESLARELEANEAPTLELTNVACRCVTKLAANLDPKYADALERIEVAGVPVKDYAAEAGITPNNAAVRVFRAREALRRQVVRSCGTCAEHGCLDCTCG